MVRIHVTFEESGYSNYVLGRHTSLYAAGGNRGLAARDNGSHFTAVTVSLPGPSTVRSISFDCRRQDCGIGVYRRGKAEVILNKAPGQGANQQVFPGGVNWSGYNYNWRTISADKLWASPHINNSHHITSVTFRLGAIRTDSKACYWIDNCIVEYLPGVFPTCVKPKPVSSVSSYILSDANVRFYSVKQGQLVRETDTIHSSLIGPNEMPVEVLAIMIRPEGSFFQIDVSGVSSRSGLFWVNESLFAKNARNFHQLPLYDANMQPLVASFSKAARRTAPEPQDLTLTSDLERVVANRTGWSVKDMASEEQAGGASRLKSVCISEDDYVIDSEGVNYLIVNWRDHGGDREMQVTLKKVANVLDVYMPTTAFTYPSDFGFGQTWADYLRNKPADRSGLKNWFLELRKIQAQYVYMALLIAWKIERGGAPLTLTHLAALIFMGEVGAYVKTVDSGLGSIMAEAVIRNIFDRESGICRNEREALDCSFADAWDYLSAVESFYNRVAPEPEGEIRFDRVRVNVLGAGRGLFGVDEGDNSQEADFFYWQAFKRLGDAINTQNKAWWDVGADRGQGPGVPSKWGNVAITHQATINKILSDINTSRDEYNKANSKSRDPLRADARGVFQDLYPGEATIAADIASAFIGSQVKGVIPICFDFDRPCAEFFVITDSEGASIGTCRCSEGEA